MTQQIQGVQQPRFLVPASSHIHGLPDCGQTPFAYALGLPCPHFSRRSYDLLLGRIVRGHLMKGSDECQACGEESGNYACTCCDAVRCGRLIGGHMLQHHDRHPKHSVVVSLRDGHVYCYVCSSFILLLRPLVQSSQRRTTATASTATQTPQRKAEKPRKLPLPKRKKKYVAKEPKTLPVPTTATIPPAPPTTLSRAAAYRAAEMEKETRRIGIMLATKLAADHSALLLDHYPHEHAAISNVRFILEDGLQRGIFAWQGLARAYRAFSDKDFEDGAEELEAWWGPLLERQPPPPKPPPQPQSARRTSREQLGSSDGTKGLALAGLQRSKPQWL